MREDDRRPADPDRMAPTAVNDHGHRTSRQRCDLRSLAPRSLVGAESDDAGPAGADERNLLCREPLGRWSSCSPDGRRCRAPCPMSWTACSSRSTRAGSPWTPSSSTGSATSSTWRRGSTRRCRRTATSATTRPIDRSGPTAGSSTSTSSPRACRATSPPPPTSRGRPAKRGSGPVTTTRGPGNRQPEGAGAAARRDGGPGGCGPAPLRNDAGGAHEVVGRPAIWSPAPSLGQPSSAHVRLRRPSFGAPSAVPS
jgi:hypothetical protein